MLTDQYEKAIKLLVESVNTPPFELGPDEPTEFSLSWGERYDAKVELAAIIASATAVCEEPHSPTQTEEFANTCHGKSDGKFCKTSAASKAATAAKAAKAKKDQATWNAMNKAAGKGYAANRDARRAASARITAINGRMAAVRAEMEKVQAAGYSEQGLLEVIRLKGEHHDLCLEGKAIVQKYRPTDPSANANCGPSANDLLKQAGLGHLAGSDSSGSVGADGIDHSKEYVGDYEIPGMDGTTCDLMQGRIRHAQEQIREAGDGIFTSDKKSAKWRNELDNLKELNRKHCAGESGSWSNVGK